MHNDICLLLFIRSLSTFNGTELYYKLVWTNVTYERDIALTLFSQAHRASIETAEGYI